MSAIGIGAGDAPDQCARADWIPHIAVRIFTIQIDKTMLNLTCYVATDASRMRSIAPISLGALQNLPHINRPT